MKTSRFFTLLLGLVAATAHAAPARVGDYAMQAKAVAPGVYAVISPARDFPSAENKGWNSNSAFVVTRDGVLVFDSGSSETIGQALRAVIAKTTDKPIRWIVNSHAHGDHWLGNKALAGPKTEIISSTAVRDRIAKEGADWVARFDRMSGGATGKSTVVVPTRVIDARTRLTFGDVEAEIIPSDSGHSPGDLLLWLPKQGVLLGGDVLYVERAPATFEANVAHWIKTLKSLETLKPAVVVPGHGPVGDAAAIARMRAYFEDLWKAVEQGYSAGKPDFEILPTAKQAMAKHAKHFPDWDKRIGESVSHIYLQVEAATFK